MIKLNLVIKINLTMNEKNIFLILIFLVMLGIIAPISTNAFSKEKLDVEFADDFVLEPTKNEVILDPGESITKTVSVTNRTERNVTFVIEMEDITGSDNPEDQVKLLGDEVGPYSIRELVKPELADFKLAPGERGTFNVRVELPIDAEPGGYYGAVIVSATDRETEAEKDAGGVAKIVTRLGSIFLVRVNGDVNESSHISNFKAIGLNTKIYSSHPKGFEVAIKNEGSVHLVHYGEIVVSNMLGKKVASFPVNAFFSLPQSTRFKEIIWNDSFSIGFYKANLTIHKGYGGEENFESAEFSFFVLPWSIVLPALALIILVTLLVIFFKRNFKIEKKK